MVEKGFILPNIHFDQPNKRIPFEQYRVRVPIALVPWPREDHRRASVNSFGYGGTNAHAIVDSFERPTVNGLDRGKQPLLHGKLQTTRQPRVFVFSARDEAGLERVRQQYITFTKMKDDGQDDELDDELDSLSHTLGSRRSILQWTGAIFASSYKELHTRLAESKLSAVRTIANLRLGFIFTGQGAQWARMGVELLRYPTYRQSFEDAETFLREHLGCDWSPIRELDRHEGDSSIQFAKFSQPICTIVQVALVDLLRQWGVRPVAVVGHSSGEIGAAYCLGALSKQAAWELAYHRGYLSSRLKHQAPELSGSMMAVGLGPESVQPYLNFVTQGKANIACVNSPSSVTMSGDAGAIREMLAKLQADNIFARELKVHLTETAPPMLKVC